MTEALGMARIHIGSATWIKLVGFNLHLVLYVEQGGEIQNYTLQRVLKIYIYWTQFICFYKKYIIIL